MQLLAEAEINRISTEYQYSLETDSDKEVLSILNDQGRRALTGAIIDGVLAGLLVLSIIINFVTLGKPLRAKKPTEKAHEKKVYGLLKEDSNN